LYPAKNIGQLLHNQDGQKTAVLGIKLHLNMLLNDGGVCVPGAQVPSRVVSQKQQKTQREKGWLDPSVEGDFLGMILGWNVTRVCALPHILQKAKESMFG